MRSPTLFAVLALGSLALPSIASAAIPFFGPIVPTHCAAGWPMLIQVVNNIIAFLITVAILFVAPIMIAWSGFLFVTNPFNSGGIAQARSILLNTIIGIVIALAGYLIVAAIMAVLYDQSTVGQTWTNLISNDGTSCLAANVIRPISNPPASGPSGISTASTGAASSRISSAANAYRGASTASGPGGGRLACAWAVNNVLRNAGVSTIDGDTVVSMESVLQSGRGTPIDQSAAQPGDLVIEAGAGHVGICLNSGCSQVISNSSSRARFDWISSTSFSPSYSNGPGRIYRVNG